MRVVATPSAPVTGTPIGVGGPPLSRGLGLGRRGHCFDFGLLTLWLRFDRFFRFTRHRLFSRLAGCRRNFSRLGGSKPRGTFLRFGLPIGAAEAFGGGEIPPACVPRISHGFEIASQFERYHGVARFRKQMGQLRRGVFSGTCSADSRGDLLPVSHTVKAF